VNWSGANSSLRVDREKGDGVPFWGGKAPLRCGLPLTEGKKY